jgi:hypothetical protein
MPLTVRDIMEIDVPTLVIRIDVLDALTAE